MMGTFPILYFQVVLLMKQKKRNQARNIIGETLKAIKKDGEKRRKEGRQEGRKKEARKEQKGDRKRN